MAKKVFGHLLSGGRPSIKTVVRSVAGATAICGLAVGAVTPHSVEAQDTGKKFEVPKLPVEKYKLPNGLTVLLSRDTSAPLIAVDVWYHVGSKNEEKGRTGFAHLFEHVMFQGSEHIPYGQHFKIIENAGGDVNGTTNNDRTNYYEVMPSNHLETALWLESDRMGFLLNGLDKAKLDAQIDVVKNERRQRIDNQPYGSMWEVITGNLYGPENPYHWPVIGSMADLSAATLDDVKNFFRKYYAPGNATLAVVGDIDIENTKALIEKYFGSIPGNDAVIERPKVAPTQLTAEKRLILEDARSQMPQYVAVWPSIGEKHPDNTALSAFGTVLTQDRTSRLTKLLVYDRELATQVYAGQQSYEDDGMFLIFVVPKPGVSLTEIERLIDSTLAAVQQNPITEAEVERFKNFTKVQTVLGLDGSMNKAEILLSGQVFYNDPLMYVLETEKTLSLTAAEVMKAGAKYLKPGRVVLSMVPAGKLDMVAKPDLPATNVTPVPEQQSSEENTVKQVGSR